MENYLIYFIVFLSIIYKSYGTQHEIDLDSNLKIQSVSRNVDLTSQIIKVKTEFEIINQGKEDLSFFIHTISLEEAKHLSWMNAFETTKDANKFRITRIKAKGAPETFVSHKIELLSLLTPNSMMKITVDYALTQYLTLYPKEISQSENQLVLYSGFANIPSAYSVNKESCTYKIGSTKPISFTEVLPSKFTSDKITYGIYENNALYTQKPISIHYENNSPFLVAIFVERIIEISHWGGNIAVEEHVEIVNKGAKLKGAFSRLDFQIDRRAGKQPMIKSFKTVLPPAIRDIYYRDEIGNISTSSVYPRNDRVEVELKPRFPLFGGWRTNYIIGYNVPSQGILQNSGSNYALKMKMMDRLYDNAVVEKLQLKIILPEMSKNIKLVTPYSVKRLPDEAHKTYLDTFGRQVIVMEKDNLINNHIQTFTLYYEFEKIYLLREPLMVIAAFGVLFLAAIILFRLDLSISNKEVKDSSQSQQKKE